MNQIPQRQNKERFLQYLAAQRQLYDEEKKWSGLWLLVVAGIAIIGSGVVVSVSSFNPYIILLTLLISIGEFSILPLITKRREEAAKIQELFDCELLGLEWNEALGNKPRPDTIREAVNRFNKQRPPEEWRRLENWYEAPSLGNFPLHQARIACQIENIRWDARQRRGYARLVCLSLAALFVLIIVIGIAANWSLQKFFTGPVLLVLPVFAIGLKNAYDHQKAADHLDKLRNQVDDLWADAGDVNADPDNITRRSRNLQTEIFHHRNDNPPVFSWFYNIVKRRYEDQG